MKKTALIIGISGQDGSLLADLLLKKDDYIIYGTSRNASENTFEILNKLDIFNKVNLFTLNCLNVDEIISVFQKISPDEVYNFSGQSSVSKSFIEPAETFNSNFNSIVYLLEAISRYQKKVKFFNASSVEIFGNSYKSINEKTLCNPVSPYGLSKAYATSLLKFYRDHYDLFLCSGIFSNHESIYREDNFVTKKIIDSAWRISNGLQDIMEIGNIDVIRDWGCAEEFMEAAYKIMQQESPTDYIIATGKSLSLKDFIDYTFSKFNLDYRKHIKINKLFFRSTEINKYKLDTKKARHELNWSAKLDVYSLIDKLILEKSQKQ